MPLRLQERQPAAGLQREAEHKASSVVNKEIIFCSPSHEKTLQILGSEKVPLQLQKRHGMLHGNGIRHHVVQVGNLKCINL
jgi:hypothetical protein